MVTTQKAISFNCARVQHNPRITCSDYCLFKYDRHKASIIDQFSRQAVPFAQVPGHTKEESLPLLLEMAEASLDDAVLDVACGPGIVACAFAPLVHHVRGIDITPAMLKQAQSLDEQRELKMFPGSRGKEKTEIHFQVPITVLVAQKAR